MEIVTLGRLLAIMSLTAGLGVACAYESDTASSESAPVEENAILDNSTQEAPLESPDLEAPPDLEEEVAPEDDYDEEEETPADEEEDYEEGDSMPPEDEPPLDEELENTL